MTPVEEALDRVIAVLDDIGVPYMVTGSVAASFHGRPRATHDVDVVIELDAQQLETLTQRLAADGFYVSPEGARTALRLRRPFNVIEMQQASKVDLIVRRERPFSREEFARRQMVDLPFRASVAMVTPEDAVVSKLEWARRAGDSERQLADAGGILDVTPTLDRAYVERWAQELGVLDLWRRISAPGEPTRERD